MTVIWYIDWSNQKVSVINRDVHLIGIEQKQWRLMCVSLWLDHVGYDYSDRVLIKKPTWTIHGAKQILLAISQFNGAFTKKWCIQIFLVLSSSVTILSWNTPIALMTVEILVKNLFRWVFKVSLSCFDDLLGFSNTSTLR
jgi:hypothetical protein